MTEALPTRRLAIRAGLALGTANARYWPGVWPLVLAELRQWESRASAIEDDELRALALAKLRSEAFNAEVAATLATTVERPQRRRAVRAIVALELLFDYLDGLTELPSDEPLRDASSLFEAFTDALDPRASAGNYYRHRGVGGDGGYLDALSNTVKLTIAELPGAGAIGDSARRSAARCAQAQIRLHAEPRLGRDQLQEWATREAQGTGIAWREFAAGAASSVLAVHALIAAAADPRITRERAAGIERAYLSICVLITVLDSLIDYDEDMQAGEPGFIRFYEDRGESLASTLVGIGRQAIVEAAELRDGAHHVMTFAGVVAYYTSAPGARGDVARLVSVSLQRELQPLIYPTLAVMCAWRLGKQAHGWLRRVGIGGSEAD
jgi:tetraprenyl-beta-curcumene synthase